MGLAQHPPHQRQQRQQSPVQQQRQLSPPPLQQQAVAWDPQVQQYLEAAMGAEQVAAMQAALAVPPLHTCVRVNTLRATPQEVVQQLQELLADALSTDGSSRFKISCHPQVPAAVLLQGSGPHAVDLSTVTKQVLISRKAGEAVLRGAHAFIPGVLGCSAGVCAGDTVALMVDLAAHGSSTTRGAVLPALHEQPPPDVAATEQQQQQPQQQEWLCAGIGKACVGRAEMFRLQHGVAVELTQRVYDVPSLNGQLQGSVMLQNLPSVVAAHVLNPPPGSRVLDMCAAPGGKTTCLAQLMGGQGQVFALDRSFAKADDIRSLAQELGCSSCITAIKMDATKAVAANPAAAAAAGAAGAGAAEAAQQQQQQDEALQEPEQQTQQQQQQQPEPLSQPAQPDQQQQQQQPRLQGMSAKAQQRLSRRLAAMSARGHTPGPNEFRYSSPAPSAPKFPGFAPESFSHVLLDAPCTALGLRPKLQQPLTLPELLDAAAYQRQLLAAAVQLVQPGGYLVFSTCSISPAENELNVRHVLDTYPCLTLVPAEPLVGGPGLRGPADAAAFAAVLARAAAETSAGQQQQPSSAKSSRSAAATAAAVATLAGEAASLGSSWLSAEEAQMVQRFYPEQQSQDTIGFFVCKFLKC